MKFMVKSNKGVRTTTSQTPNSGTTFVTGRRSYQGMNDFIENLVQEQETKIKEERRVKK
ncbi:hypothetical protein TrRE_jg462, partial [Triparma retinervis]